MMLSHNLIPNNTKQPERIEKSEITEQIQKRVMDLTTNMSEQLAKEMRIQSSSEELDIKGYVNQVIQEVKGNYPQ
jgi:hypothetical protein